LSESSRPTLAEIATVLAHLSDRALTDPDRPLDPVLAASLRRVTDELRAHIPGLEPPPDATAAGFLERAAAAALSQGREREALSRALRGLAYAPQDPNLHYLAGSACFELGEVQAALAFLSHALWVNPGHADARRDLNALALFYDEEAPPEEREPRRPDRRERRRDSHPPPRSGPMRFELSDDDEERTA
jgi:tetratricopeptide (TPR) repeat protein